MVNGPRWFNKGEVMAGGVVWVGQHSTFSITVERLGKQPCQLVSLPPETVPAWFACTAIHGCPSRLPHWPCSYIYSILHAYRQLTLFSSCPASAYGTPSDMLATYTTYHGNLHYVKLFNVYNKYHVVDCLWYKCTVTSRERLLLKFYGCNFHLSLPQGENFLDRAASHTDKVLGAICMAAGSKLFAGVGLLARKSSTWFQVNDLLTPTAPCISTAYFSTQCS